MSLENSASELESGNTASPETAVEPGEGETLDITVEPETPEELRQIRQEIPGEQFSGSGYGKQDSGEFVEEAMNSEQSEALDGSLTNELAMSQVGTVLKEFSARPKMAYVQMLGRIPAKKLEYQDQQSRIENERKFREFSEDTDVYTPEIIGAEGEYVEFETVDGVDMNTLLNEASKDEAEEAGFLVGSFLDDIHGRDGAITDLRINNFMMQEEGGLAFVDAEYFTEDASDWEKKMDLITMTSSVKQVDSDAYRSFREGFQESYGEDIDVYTDAISSVTSPGHAAVLEKDLERTGNSLRNVKENASEYVRGML